LTGVRQPIRDGVLQSMLSTKDEEVWHVEYECAFRGTDERM
jgi:hypothetical protein